MWYEQQGQRSSRFTSLMRGNERGNQGPLFIIDPKTVQRYQVNRLLTVERLKS